MVDEVDGYVEEGSASENVRFQRVMYVVGGGIILALVMVMVMFPSSEKKEDVAQQFDVESSAGKGNGDPVEVTNFREGVDRLLAGNQRKNERKEVVEQENTGKNVIDEKDLQIAALLEELDKIQGQLSQKEQFSTQGSGQNGFNNAAQKSPRQQLDEKLKLAERKRAFIARHSRQQFSYPSAGAKAEASAGNQYREQLNSVANMEYTGNIDNQLGQIARHKKELQELQNLISNPQPSHGNSVPVAGGLYGSSKRQLPDGYSGLSKVEAEAQHIDIDTNGMLKIPATTVINAVLTQKEISDYVGEYTALVTHDVYDARLEYILLPKGTKVSGRTLQVSNVNEAIQNRMGMTVDMFVLPDGTKIETSVASAMDIEGINALKDKVNYHILAQFLGVAAYAIVSSGTDSDRSSPDTGEVNVRGDIEQGVRNQTSPLIQKFLNIKPTIELHNGMPFKIFIKDEMYVKPWKSIYDDYVPKA